MVSQGKELAKIHKNVTIKLPLTHEGLKACKVFSKLGNKTNVALCFTPAQAWLAAKVGATFVSPFVGRLDDIGQDGMALIAEIKKVYDAYDFKTEILVASIRNTDHVLRAISIGAHVGTMPYSVFSKLIHHPLTDSGLAKFLEDWKNAKLV